MTLKVFHSRRISYKVIYEKMGISASWSVSWRCQCYQQASSLLVGCSIGLVLLQQMLYHQESWYSSQVDEVCLCPFIWYPALWPVVWAVLRDIVEQAHGGLWRWEMIHDMIFLASTLLKVMIWAWYNENSSKHQVSCNKFWVNVFNMHIVLPSQCILSVTQITLWLFHCSMLLSHGVEFRTLALDFHIAAQT